MLLETWLTFLVLGCAIISSFFFLYAAIRYSSGMYFSFWLGIVALGVSRFLYFYRARLFTYEFLRDYIALIALVFVLIGLFILIRESKPSFARFPSQFTLVPLIIVPIYPLIDQSQVLRDLISTILQGGGLVVTFLIVVLNQFKKADYLYIILGVIALLAAYVFKWIINLGDDYGWIWQMLLAIGMIISTYGFYKLSISTNKKTIQYD